jgi:DNA-binding ferritin-like protein (Dps family)
MMDFVTIEGITFNRVMLDELKRWYNVDERDDSLPVDYVADLGELQDFVSRMMVNDYAGQDDIMDMLAKIICLKDALRNFIPPKVVRDENGEIIDIIDRRKRQ